MYNVNPPPASELPSSRTLLRSTAVAAGVALVLLVNVVMPAEYGVDPTGIGRVTGLTEMGEIKMALAEEAAAAEAAEEALALEMAPAPTVPAAPSEPAPGAAVAVAKTDSVSVSLAPGEGKEIKLAMNQGASVQFLWTVDGGVVNSDTHADRPGLDYHGYMKGTGQASDEGVLVAAFDGMHGWFWRNRGRVPVTLTLRTNGEYEELRRME